MKILALVLISLICLASVALAEKDSIIVGGQFRNMSFGGPYNVSFDLGMPKDSYDKDMFQITRSIVVGLGGGNRTTFYIKINNKSANVYETDDPNLSSYTPNAIIMLEEYDQNQPIVSDELLQELLISDARRGMGTPFKDSAYANTTMLAIDNTTGAFTFISLVPPERKIYFVEYYPLFDPMRVHLLIESLYPWNEGTLQLLKTIHVERMDDGKGKVNLSE